SGNDTLEGRGGVNHLSGMDGNDSLRGGSGVSNLNGGEGDDTYLYGVGDGDCYIINHDIRGGVDVLRFLEGIRPDELSVTRDRTNLVLTVNSGVITVVSYFQNGGNNSDVLNAIEFFDGTRWGYDDVMSRLILGTQGANTLYGDAVDDQFNGFGGDDTLFGADGNDQLRGDEGRDRLYGEMGDDVLEGGADDDWLYGGEGNDLQDGQGGDDILIGGLGDDRLQGGVGDDRYYFSVGDGRDVIDNTGGGFDCLCFSDLTQDRLDFYQDGDDLVVWVDGDSGQSVRVLNHFLDADVGIDVIELIDDRTMSAEQIAALVVPMPQAGNGATDEPGSPPQEDTIADTVVPQPSGDAVLTGLDADEVLIAGAGDDTYLYTGGVDVLEETSGVDTLRFENGITFDQVASGLLMSGNDLILSVDGGSDQITLRNFFLGGDWLVETIEFATGGSVSAEEIFDVFGLTLPNGSDAFDQVVSGTSARDVLAGQEGNDLLEGWSGNDSLTGGAGDDRLVGGLGDDFYTFSAGDGHDVIDNSGGGYDTLVFRDIDFNEVLNGLMRSGDDLVVQLASTNDQVTLLNFFLGGDYAVDRLVKDRRRNITAEQIFARFGVVNPDPQGSLAIPDLPDEQVYETQTLGDFDADHYQGSSGSDFIHAGGGDDQILGNGGDDYLIGGRGSDLYLMGAQSGQDRINNYDAGDEGVDTLRFATTDYESLWFSRDENDLCITNTGSGDSVTLEHWYDSTDYEVDRIEVDGAVLLNQQVDQLVAAMAAYNVPSGAGEVIPQAVREELQPVLAENWQAMA
ncbi:MAG: calcium-binding protein, partial [Candidatus Thiodiazotropha sp.]